MDRQLIWLELLLTELWLTSELRPRTELLEESADPTSQG